MWHTLATLHSHIKSTRCVVVYWLLLSFKHFAHLWLLHTTCSSILSLGSLNTRLHKVHTQASCFFELLGSRLSLLAPPSRFDGPDPFTVSCKYFALTCLILLLSVFWFVSTFSCDIVSFVVQYGWKQYTVSDPCYFVIVVKMLSISGLLFTQLFSLTTWVIGLFLIKNHRPGCGQLELLLSPCSMIYP